MASLLSQQLFVSFKVAKKRLLVDKRLIMLDPHAYARISLSAVLLFVVCSLLSVSVSAVSVCCAGWVCALLSVLKTVLTAVKINKVKKYARQH